MTQLVFITKEILEDSILVDMSWETLHQPDTRTPAEVRQCRILELEDEIAKLEYELERLRAE